VTFFGDERMQVSSMTYSDATWQSAQAQELDAGATDAPRCEYTRLSKLLVNLG
jgi:hypothetical protein